MKKTVRTTALTVHNITACLSSTTCKDDLRPLIRTSPRRKIGRPCCLLTHMRTISPGTKVRGASFPFTKKPSKGTELLTGLILYSRTSTVLREHHKSRSKSHARFSKVYIVNIKIPPRKHPLPCSLGRGRKRDNIRINTIRSIVATIKK